MDEEAKIRQFAEVAKTIFAPAYPAVARQIINTLGIKQGMALEVGIGPGLLAYELVKQSELKVFALDNKFKALVLAKEILNEKGADFQRLYLCCGDVLNLPFPNHTFNLVCSRGSFFFWQDKIKGLKEIYRVLRPGGRAMIGGGFGKKEIKEEICVKIKTVYPDWEKRVAKRRREFSQERLYHLALKAGIKDPTVIYDEINMWIVFAK
jgi:ubiquinone/menaquinone biosynthesis C-methylase UbiE